MNGDFENRNNDYDYWEQFRRLKPTCAKNRVPVRKILGYVEFYAPASSYKLRLALHHI